MSDRIYRVRYSVEPWDNPPQGLMTRLIKSTWDEEQRNSRKVLRYDLFQCGGSK